MVDPFHLLRPDSMNTGRVHVAIETCLRIIFLQLIGMIVQDLCLGVELLLEQADLSPLALERPISLFPRSSRRVGDRLAGSQPGESN